MGEVTLTVAKPMHGVVKIGTENSHQVRTQERNQTMGGKPSTWGASPSNETIAWKPKRTTRGTHRRGTQAPRGEGREGGDEKALVAVRKPYQMCQRTRSRRGYLTTIRSLVGFPSPVSHTEKGPGWKSLKLFRLGRGVIHRAVHWSGSGRGWGGRGGDTTNHDAKEMEGVRRTAFVVRG